VTKSVFTDRYERFRLLLIEARKVAGLTQAQLATKLSRPQSYVSKYERGERSLDVVEFLETARVLGIDACKLLKKLDGPRSLR
jgi:transcriptional regulator with XRE-family HTH domain